MTPYQLGDISIGNILLWSKKNVYVCLKQISNFLIFDISLIYGGRVMKILIPM